MRVEQAHCRIYLAVVLLALSACAVNPFRTAQTLEQRGDALYGSFVIAQKQAVEVIRDESVPDSAKRIIGELDAEAKPVADELYAAILELARVQREIIAGTDKQEQVRIAAAHLDGLITTFAPLIANMRARIEEHR